MISCLKYCSRKSCSTLNTTATLGFYYQGARATSWEKRQCRRCYNALFDAQMVAAANFADHNDVLFCVTSWRDAL